MWVRIYAVLSRLPPHSGRYTSSFISAVIMPRKVFFRPARLTHHRPTHPTRPTPTATGALVGASSDSGRETP